MRKFPPLQALLAFEAASRLGSFTRAAVELALTQSAISHQILQLEEWTGQPLFRRVGRGVVLTAAGELYAKTVANALTILSDGRDRIDAYGNPDSVVLCCTPQFATGWLVPRLQELRRSLPNIEVWLTVGWEPKEIDRLDVDLVISENPIFGTEVIRTQLPADTVVAICGAQTASLLKDVAFPEVLGQAPLLISELRPDWAPWLPELRRSGLKINRAMTIDDDRLVVAAAEQEAGIALVPRYFAEVALRQGRVQLLSQVPGYALSPIWLMKSSKPARNHSVEIIHDWIVAECR
ncbi:LysR substrate-binding domain-containing protein [Pseudomonas sp. NPDC078700]|uniref:LysR substrate-binding domain-containing protein n=1 Tax=Pseudomonas sp. NPDC078700 TaxID=3364424 RepID=UPI0037C60CD6